MHAILVKRHGGPEVLEYSETADPKAGPGELLVRMHAAGVNFIEIYLRTGAYASTVPYTPGTEGAGIIEQIGPGVTGLKVGDPVASASFRGSYGELGILPAERAVLIPKGVPMDVAAGAMLQGMTAQYLVRSSFSLQKDQWCLIHAAAGGVGQLLVRFAKHIGAHVIATVSTEEKAHIAKQCGADHVIVYGIADFSTEVKQLTEGKGAHVVYDGVGKDTVQRSLASLRTRGMMVLYGAASGPVPTIDVAAIQKQNLFFTRPALVAYTATRDELVLRANEVFQGIKDGWLPVHIDRTFPLHDAAAAHEYLAARKTKGKLLLKPSPSAKA
ncbi:MAG TPA: quinone oxidoreductase [Candidatus Thermoplasmatota archaeon]